MTTIKNVAVKILGKDYQVSCPEDKTHHLIDASILLDSKMKEIKDSGRIIGLDRIAIMAALNLANDLQVHMGNCKTTQFESEQHLIKMYDKLEEVLEIA